MSDICDEAARITDSYIDQCVKAAVSGLTDHHVMSNVCDDCGEEIDPQRLEKVKGCRTCFSCQVSRENGRHYNPR